MDVLDVKIEERIKRVRRRLRGKSLGKYVLLGTAAGFFGSFLLSAITLFWPFYRMPYFIAAWMGIALAAGVVVGIKRTPSMEQAALMADAKGLAERLSTAWFLRGEQTSFARLQKQDALSHSQSLDIRKEFPIRIPLKAVGLVVLSGLLFLGSCFLDTPARREADNRKRLDGEIQEQLARLEEAGKELVQAGGKELLSDGEFMELLESTRQELSEVDSLAALQKMEERFAQKLEAEKEKTDDVELKNALEQLAKELQAESAGLQEQIAKEAKEALEKAQNGSDLDKAEAVEKMKELAESMSSEALKKAAEAYENANYSSSSYNVAKSALEQSAEKLANATVSQNPSGQSGQSGEQGENGGSTQNEGGQGTEGGQGAGAGAGEGGQGAGAGAGEGGQGAGGQGVGGSGWNYGGKDGQEGAAKVNENITVPTGTLGEDANLTGSANQEGSSTITSSNEAQTWAGNKVSYDQVSGTYREKAYQQIDRSNYPANMKNRIKNYFDGLN